MNYVCVSLCTVAATRNRRALFGPFFYKSGFFSPSVPSIKLRASPFTKTRRGALHSRLPAHLYPFFTTCQAGSFCCCHAYPPQPGPPTAKCSVFLNFTVARQHESAGAAAGLPFTSGLIGFRLGGRSAFTSCAAAARDTSTTGRVCQIKVLFIRGATS